MARRSCIILGSLTPCVSFSSASWSRSSSSASRKRRRAQRRLPSSTNSRCLLVCFVATLPHPCSGSQSDLAVAATSPSLTLVVLPSGCFLFSAQNAPAAVQRQTPATMQRLLGSVQEAYKVLINPRAQHIVLALSSPAYVPGLLRVSGMACLRRRVSGRVCLRRSVLCAFRETRRAPQSTARLLAAPDAVRA